MIDRKRVFDYEVEVPSADDTVITPPPPGCSRRRITLHFRLAWQPLLSAASVDTSSRARVSRQSAWSHVRVLARVAAARATHRTVSLRADESRIESSYRASDDR